MSDSGERRGAEYNPMLFELRNVKQVFGDRTVLDVPALAFEEGLVYALLGPNGSGKTTLLEILSLLTPPTTGEIRYYNHPVRFGNGSEVTALRRQIVLVHQNPVLFTSSVYKNVEFGPRVRGLSKNESERIIDESLDLVGMREFRNAEAHKLSGGETHRVAIARALACSPKVLFFDEPTANVDVESQVAIERIIADVNTQKGISIVLTTHDHIQAARLSQRVISLFDGRLVPSTFENIFSGKIITGQDETKLFQIQDEIRFAVETKKKGPVRSSIDPRKIRLLKDGGSHTASNLFKGRLIQLTAEQGHIRAVVDIGVPLNVFLAADSLTDPALVVGEELAVLVPREAVRVFVSSGKKDFASPHP
jgi:tungstate transport system ATP-binding protein